MLTDVRRFPCPTCRNIIDDTTNTCRFCKTEFNQQEALAAADLQDRVNRACSDASYLKTVGIASLVFLGLSLIPVVPLFGPAFYVTFVVLIVLLIRWQVRFGKLKATDPDFDTAIGRRNLGVVLLIANIVGFFAIQIIFTLITRSRL